MAYKQISPQSVDEGGTGAETLTGVLTGNGTSAITANAITQYATLVGGASNAVSEVASVGTSGQVLTSNGAGSNPTYQDAAGGVAGPVSSTDNALARWNGTGGDTLQDSTVIVTDNGEMTNASQPAFLGEEQTSATNTTGAGTNYPLGSGQALVEIFDQNGDFTVGDGMGAAATFTCPVDGIVKFQGSIAISAVGNRNRDFFTTSNRDYMCCNYDIQGIATASGYNFFSDGVLADMDAADTCTYSVTQLDGAGDTCTVRATVSSQLVTYFSGCLVC